MASHQGLEQIIDVGCGEGYYSHRLQDAQQKPIIAFDISKEAIQTAAQGVNGICWLVADITNIPLQSDCSDCILDVFTPSNYGEFSRLLKDDGLLIKVIPGENHLIELRHAAKGLIQRDSYSNESVVDYFKQHFKTEDQLFLSKTIPVNPEQLKKLWQMTPLLFGVSDKDLDALKVSEITIEAQVLVGSKI